MKMTKFYANMLLYLSILAEILDYSGTTICQFRHY